MNITVERILLLAKERGVKQSFINNLIGGYRGKLTDWKSGKSSPTKEEIQIIAQYFRVSESYLNGKSENKNLPNQICTNEFLQEVADLTESELEDVKEYIKFLKNKRKNH